MTQYAQRRKALLHLLAHSRLDALLVTSPPNVRYLSGFTGSNGLLLVTPNRSWLLTDPRYTIQASQESDCKVKIVRGPLLPAIPRLTGRLGFNPSHLTVSGLAALRKVSTANLKPAEGLVESLRLVKSPAEIDLIRRSVLLNSEALSRALKHAKPGMAERELAAEIDYQMLLLGAEKPAFDTIVASGPRTALPHAQPSQAPIRINELLLIDMGAQLAGYMSDMTRMVFPGTPDRKARRLYQAVLDAQLEATASVRDGVPAAAVDRAARKVLKTHKLDRLFTHSTGHGLGLEIHEAPRVAKKQETLLRAGMMITVEPGIYMEGYGGIRIEDTVLVTRTGSEVLTPTPKDLFVL